MKTSRKRGKRKRKKEKIKKKQEKRYPFILRCNRLWGQGPYSLQPGAARKERLYLSMKGKTIYSKCFYLLEFPKAKSVTSCFYQMSRHDY